MNAGQTCELILDGCGGAGLCRSLRWEKVRKKNESAMRTSGTSGKRPVKTTRLVCEIFSIFPRMSVEITVTDLGFGEMFPSSGKVWTETAQMVRRG